MKLKEFKNEVEKIACKYGIDLTVVEDDCDYFVKFESAICAAVSKELSYSMDAGFVDFKFLEDDLRGELLDVLYGFAKTPLDERDMEKKFYIASKLTPDADGSFVQYKNGIVIHGYECDD